jgi:ribosomal protein S18 acetylase RimI-like enzyme
MTAGGPFLRDAFLEQWLGYPVFRLRDTGAAHEAIAQAAAHDRWMVDTRVAVDRVGELAQVTGHGFRLIDTNVQLERPAAAREAASGGCRFAVAADEAQVRAIAASSFTQTRFHLDPQIPDTLANRVKEEWVGNFFAGRRGQWLVVAEHEGRVSGFCQVLRNPDDVLVIDLIAVAEHGRGRGLARAMIEYAATTCLGRPAAMLVGTQIANVRSLALYTRLGFSVASASYIFHLHSRNRAR